MILGVLWCQKADKVLGNCPAKVQSGAFIYQEQGWKTWWCTASVYVDMVHCWD